MASNEVLEQASTWLAEGRKVALATVIETWGSAPQPVGSQLAIDGEGNFAGSVSGGCVEGAVVSEALDAIASGQPKVLAFGVADETAWQVGLACGGKIQVFVEPLGAVKRALLKAVLEAGRERRAVAVVTTIENGEQRLVAKENLGDDPLGAVLEEAFRFDQSGLHGGEFVHIHNPPLRLVIIGAVHIAQGVIPMARQAGYDITVIDPRGAFATGARFPDITLHTTWPEDVLPGLGADARTALLALTHDPKIDDPALSIALKSECFYIGALGSKKTQASRVERLQKMGFSDAVIARIHGPIGLPIGAKGAAEIAISIMAEMTRSLRLGN